MEINFHKRFDKQFIKLPTKAQQEFKQRLILFIGNPFNHTLNNHILSGKYEGCRSINITGDLQAIYEIKNGSIYFMMIGTHSELYS